jgi:hypothetical protein
MDANTLGSDPLLAERCGTLLTKMPLPYLFADFCNLGSVPF